MLVTTAAPPSGGRYNDKSVCWQWQRPRRHNSSGKTCIELQT